MLWGSRRRDEEPEMPAKALRLLRMNLNQKHRRLRFYSLTNIFTQSNIVTDIVTVQCRNMLNRIFRKKEYSLLEQVPSSVADFNALAVRNYEGTE